jgi:hypothetical protein
MKNIYSSIRPGFIVRSVYPVVSGYLQQRLERIKNPVTKHFLDTQPNNVLDILRWENRKFPNIKPTEDPIKKDFIRTGHPKIFLIVPKDTGGGRSNMTPMFYACPKCNGRLFWGMPYCGWCGVSVTKCISMKKGDTDTFLNLIDYIFPQSLKPSIAPILSSLTRPDETIVNEEEINNSELKQMMKEIDKFIPITAYVESK